MQTAEPFSVSLDIVWPSCCHAILDTIAGRPQPEENTPVAAVGWW